MLDFNPVYNKEIAILDFGNQFSVADLQEATNTSIDHILSLMTDCADADVTFEPNDPRANDTYAEKTDETNMPWTLGHVIVHVTASSEEMATTAVELARGVPFHGRSRSEVPWETIKTVAQCQHRLAESRRMRLASLDMWPDNPDLENLHEPWPTAGQRNAKSIFLSGLMHEASHYEQIAEIVRQANTA